jgi:endonuclease YncB( thermonuclease family)
MKKVWIDPPSGWMFGFPKVWDRQGDLNAWLVKEGYPQKEIDSLGEHFYVRVWESDEK